MDALIKCKFCGRECKNKNSLTQHEIRCKLNPDHIICYGNKGNMPQHTGAYYKSKIKVCGTELNITHFQLDSYRKEHNRCEICGRTLEESINSVNKFAPKVLCVDHCHSTSLFRGILCSTCNRQLGWFEKYQTSIINYLNKEFPSFEDKEDDKG